MFTGGWIWKEGCRRKLACWIFFIWVYKRAAILNILTDSRLWITDINLSRGLLVKLTSPLLLSSPLGRWSSFSRWSDCNKYDNQFLNLLNMWYLLVDTRSCTRLCCQLLSGGTLWRRAAAKLVEQSLRCSTLPLRIDLDLEMKRLSSAEPGPSSQSQIIKKYNRKFLH